MSTYTSGNDLLNGFDTYILSEAQAGKLQGATFKPPVGTAGSDYVVQVIGRSVDGSDVATTSQSITYNIAPVIRLNRDLRITGVHIVTHSSQPFVNPPGEPTDGRSAGENP